jgi:hypothetical protein
VTAPARGQLGGLGGPGSHFAPPVGAIAPQHVLDQIASLCGRIVRAGTAGSFRINPSDPLGAQHAQVQRCVHDPPKEWPYGFQLWAKRLRDTRHRYPVRRLRLPRAVGATGYSCGAGPRTFTKPTPYGGPGYGYWKKWCAPQGYAREFATGGPAEGTLIGGNRVAGLFDPHWGEAYAKLSPSTFDPSRPWLKLPGLQGWWSPPTDQLAPPPQPNRKDHVTGIAAHPLLSGRLYTLLCKAPPKPLDWCCHMPGNYSYVNFIQDEVTAVRYLNSGWKCEPRGSSRSRECLAGWTPAVSLLPPEAAGGFASRRPQSIIPGVPPAGTLLPPGAPAPGGPGAGAGAGRCLRCQQVNQFGQLYGPVVYELDAPGRPSPHNGAPGWSCAEVSRSLCSG